MLNREQMKKQLIKMGGDPTLKGFDYVLDAMEELDTAEDKLPLMSLHEKIGKREKSSRSAVERAIRYFLNELKKSSKAVADIGEFGKFGASGKSLYLLYEKFKEEQEEKGLFVQVTDDAKRLKMQIDGLKWELLREDLPEKDRTIFEESLKILRRRLNELGEEGK